jgi:hypothetical protein
MRLVGHRPKSLREALLHELCTKLGYCNSLTVDDLTAGLDVDEIVRMVFVAEGMDPDASMLREDLREPVAQIVDDWLFDPNGRGRRSRLPREREPGHGDGHV